MIFKNRVEKEIKPQISISRSFGIDGTYITLEIKDRVSNVHVAKFQFTLEQFAKAITGECVDLEAGVVYQNPHLGMKHINETFLVPFPEDMPWETFISFAKEEVALKKPGWIMDSMGNYNSYCVVRKDLKKGIEQNFYKVVIRKWE